MSRDLPNLDLKGAYADGADGWGDDQNDNLLKLSVLVQGGVAEIVAAEPGAPTPGLVVILDETNVANPNAVAVWDGETGAEAWTYYAPAPGWLLWDNNQDKYVSFDGTTWAVLETGGGGGVEEAPEDGLLYGRKDAGWEEIVAAESRPDMTRNGLKYVRVKASEDGLEYGTPSGGGGGDDDGLTRTVPLIADFPYSINNAGITYTETVDALEVTQGVLSFQTHGLFADKPVGNFTCWMEMNVEWANFGNNCRFGIGLRNSVTGRLQNFGFFTQPTGTLENATSWWSSPTDYSGDTRVRATAARKKIWLRLTWDGTDLKMSIGNGRFYAPDVIADAASRYIGAFDQVGIQHQFEIASLWRITSFGFTDPAL